MVPDKFNMVDMEGIDILFSYGDTIQGLYQKLVESITQCRYQCLYNWYFDGVLIPPTYVEMVVIENKVWIGYGVSVDEEDTLVFVVPALKSITGAIAHITDALPRKANQIVCYINPIQTGTGDPSPDNVRPISGWTGANIEQRGKNRFDVSKITVGKYLNSDGSTTDSSGWDISDYMEIDNESVFITGVGTPGNTPKSCWFDANKAFLSSFANQAGSTTINKPSGAKFLRLSIYNDDKNNIEAWDGARGIPIDWQTEAGTIYGGTVTLNEDGSLKMVVTDGEIASYNGEILPSTWISSMDVYDEGVTPTIGAQVVYKLAEPLIYHLAPIQVPVLFQGENNVWHDANGDTSVTYWYDKI